MELVVASRDVGKKLDSKRLRRQGRLPAVIYAPGQKTETIDIDANEFKKMLSKIAAGTLSTCIFTLKRGSKEVRAILKDIQYQITPVYEPIHLDFEELKSGQPITINVPIQLSGVADCVGAKLGGVLRQVERYLRVCCLPDKIPPYFEIDVRDLNVGQSKRMEDIVLPPGVRALGDTRQVVAVVGKR